MRTRAKIATPFPSAESTGKKLGVSREIVKQLSDLAEHSKKTGLFVMPESGGSARGNRKPGTRRKSATAGASERPSKKS